jgi:hypothetical protein
MIRLQKKEAVTNPGDMAYTDYAPFELDGITRDTEQENLRTGLTRAYAIRPNQGLIVILASGYTWRAGPDFDTIAVAYQYSWGGN